MSTRITVNSSSDALLASARQVQQANREAQLQKQRDARTTAAAASELAVSTVTAPVGGTPDTATDRRPAAFRNQTGIFAAELLTEYVEETDEFFIKVSVPDTSHELQVTAESSGRGTVELPYYENVFGLFTVYGRVTRDATSGWWSVYRDGSFGGGTNFIDRTAEPPRTSDSTEIYYTRSQKIGEKSSSLLLPLSSKDGVLIYVHNRIEINHIYERNERRVFASVNERNVTLAWGDLGYQADWDAEGHTTYTYTKHSQADFEAYELFAFYVSEDGVKQIDVPQALDTHLRAIYPPVNANSSGQYLSTIDFDTYYAHNPAAFVDVITSNRIETFQAEPSFDANVWAANSRYGTTDWQKTALAQHFGLGYLNTSFHYGEFFTPAIYTYLTGPMTLDVDDALNYAHMRSNYFLNAPFQFYAPCARTNACQDSTVTEFDVLRTQPTNVTTAVPQNLFARNPRTDVTIGEPVGVVHYAWDWGKPGACRRKLLELGFSPADLRQ
jgi:hypothetical protein